MSNGYVTLKIPKSLANKMDKLVGRLGFASRAEVAKESIRKLLLEYRQLRLPNEFVEWAHRTGIAEAIAGGEKAIVEALEEWLREKGGAAHE